MKAVVCKDAALAVADRLVAPRSERVELGLRVAGAGEELREPPLLAGV